VKKANFFVLIALHLKSLRRSKASVIFKAKNPLKGKKLGKALAQE